MRLVTDRRAEGDPPKDGQAQDDARPECYECENLVDAVVEIGEQPVWYETATTWVCRDCLRKALALIESKPCPTTTATNGR